VYKDNAIQNETHTKTRCLNRYPNMYKQVWTCTL